MAEERLGVHLAGIEFKRWPWIFRDVTTEDYGVDCEVEVKDATYAKGRLAGLQIKTGRAKYFRSPAPRGAGWWYSPDARPDSKPDPHLRYWLEHDLRVVVILVDETTEDMYWVHVTLDAVRFTGSSWKILVPASQRLDRTAKPAFEALLATPNAVETDILAAALQVLPPQAADLLTSLGEQHSFKALQLAVVLSRGAEAPAATCDWLLRPGARRYLSGAGARLYVALAAYAAEHQCHVQAAAAFERAAAAEASTAGRYLALAAWSMLGAGRPDQAAVYLREAEAAHASTLLCEWIRAVAGYDRPGFPHMTDEVIRATRADPDAEPLYRVFLAEHAAGQGEFTSAVRMYEGALEREPRNTGLMVLLCHVLLAREASQLAPVADADVRRVVELATAARDQRRRWGGPSEEPLVVLLNALQMSSDFAAARRVACPSPLGEATAREAASAPVAFLGVRISLALGDGEAARAIASRISGQEPHARAIRLMLTSPQGSDAGHGWIDVLQDAASDPALAVYAAGRAAAMGLWPIARVEELRSRGELTGEGYELLKARSQAANGELDAAVRAIRPYARLSAIATETLVEILADAGRREEALTQCEHGLQRFPTAPLVVKQWSLLAGLERNEDAAARAVALLARPGLSPGLRAMLRDYLIAEAHQRRDWSVVDEYCHAALLDGAEHSAVKWAYIRAAYNRHRWREAWERLGQLNPPITTSGEAGLWLSLHAHHHFDERAALEAFDLIDRFPDDIVLHRRVISAFTTRFNKVAADGEPVLPLDSEAARERYQQALARFLALGAPGADVITSGPPEQVMAQAQALMTGLEPRQLFLRTSVCFGTMPLAEACRLAGQSYAQALLEREYGPITAVTMEDSCLEAEMAAAEQALDGAVVLDASALAVGCELPGEHFAALCSAFATLVMDDAARFDCLSACGELRQVPGSVSVLVVGQDGRSVQPQTMDDTVLEVLMRRANALERLVAGLDAAEPGEQKRILPWQRLADLARGRSGAVWCDDVALRAELRANSCPAFGTVALMHVLAGDDLHSEDRLRQEVVALAAAGVGDIMLEPVEIAALAAGHGGGPGPVGDLLAHPRYWSGWEAGRVIAVLLEVLNTMGPIDDDAVADWFAAVSRGLAPFLDLEHVDPALRSYAASVVASRQIGGPGQAALARTVGRVVAEERWRRHIFSVLRDGAVRQPSGGDGHEQGPMVHITS